jgi:membrane fusion protein (multidrug efflux system)
MPNQRFDATIARISPTIDASNGTFRATAIINNVDGELAPGMFGRFTVAYEKHSDALLVPTDAILDEDDESTVYVVQDGEVVRRTVKTGVENDGRVEILDGLLENEQVVVVGHSGLRDGSKVLASATDLNAYTG